MRIVTTVFLVGLALAAPVLALGQVKLTELMPNPEGGDAGREWVEAVNLGGVLTVTTGRSGWRLSDGDNHFLKGDNFSWQSNEVVLFVQDAQKFRADYPSVSNRLVESSFSLKNSGGVVRLLNEQGTILTEANYGQSDSGYSFIASGDSWVRGQANGAPGTYPDPAAGESKSSPSAIASTQSQPAVSAAQPAPSPASVEPKTLLLATPAPTPATVPAAPVAAQPIETAPPLLVSEFLPNAEGRDDNEFIELANTGGGETKLDDVTVQVGEKKIKLSGTANGAFVVLSKKDYRFNIRNKGETITLFWQDKPVHKISYSGAAPAGRSFARLANGNWVWTEPTPGAANTLVEVASADRNADKNGDKRRGATQLEELPLTAQVKTLGRASSSLAAILPANFTPLLAGLASALLLSLAVVVFLK